MNSPPCTPTSRPTKPCWTRRAQSASDIALVGDEATVRAGLERLASAGVTDFLAGIMGRRDATGR